MPTWRQSNIYCSEAVDVWLTPCGNDVLNFITTILDGAPRSTHISACTGNEKVLYPHAHILTQDPCTLHSSFYHIWYPEHVSWSAQVQLQLVQVSRDINTGTRRCTWLHTTAHKFAQHHAQVPKMHSSSAKVHSSSMQVHPTSAQSHLTPVQLHSIILAWLMANYQTTPICYSILNCAFEIVTSTSIYLLWSASLKFGW